MFKLDRHQGVSINPGVEGSSYAGTRAHVRDTRLGGAARVSSVSPLRGRGSLHVDEKDVWRRGRSSLVTAGSRGGVPRARFAGGPTQNRGGIELL